MKKEGVPENVTETMEMILGFGEQKNGLEEYCKKVQTSDKDKNEQASGGMITTGQSQVGVAIVIALALATWTCL